MTLRKPESMDDLVYYTRRAVGKGHVTCWVFREECPECGKALMGKPRNPKTGDVKIRAKEFVCPECNHTVEKTAYEESLQANIEYTCPECEHSDEKQIPFKRKKVKGTDSLVFNCDACNAKILVTKKMKKIGEKE